MRPSPNEVAEGLRRILAETVRPAVDDDYARARLEEARGVLAQVDWDDVGLRLLREHRALLSLAARVAAATGTTPPDVPSDAPPHYDDLVQARNSLDEWIIERLEHLSDDLHGEVEAFYLG